MGDLGDFPHHVHHDMLSGELTFIASGVTQKNQWSCWNGKILGRNGGLSGDDSPWMTTNAAIIHRYRGDK